MNNSNKKKLARIKFKSLREKSLINSEELIISKVKLFLN